MYLLYPLNLSWKQTFFFFSYSLCGYSLVRVFYSEKFNKRESLLTVKHYERERGVWQELRAKLMVPRKHKHTGQWYHHPYWLSASPLASCIFSVTWNISLAQPPWCGEGLFYNQIKRKDSRPSGSLHQLLMTFSYIFPCFCYQPVDKQSKHMHFPTFYFKKFKLHKQQYLCSVSAFHSLVFFLESIA